VTSVRDGPAASFLLAWEFLDVSYGPQLLTAERPFVLTRTFFFPSAHFQHTKRFRCSSVLLFFGPLYLLYKSTHRPKHGPPTKSQKAPNHSSFKFFIFIRISGIDDPLTYVTIFFLRECRQLLCPSVRTSLLSGLFRWRLTPVSARPYGPSRRGLYLLPPITFHFPPPLFPSGHKLARFL